MAIVFFDVDHTLIKGPTGIAIIRFFLKRGKFNTFHVLQGLYYTLLHYLNLVNGERMLLAGLKPFVGDRVDEMVKEADECFRRHIKPRFYREALERIAEHQNKGDIVVLLSAGSKYVVGHIASALGIEYIASGAIVRDGIFTCELEQPVCYGHGKVQRAERFCSARNVCLEESTFYTDSSSDLPMLELVRCPVAVNPDPILKREARRWGWPILFFNKRLGSAPLSTFFPKSPDSNIIQKDLTG